MNTYYLEEIKGELYFTDGNKKISGENNNCPLSLLEAITEHIRMTKEPIKLHYCEPGKLTLMGNLHQDFFLSSGYKALEHIVAIHNKSYK